MGPAPPPRYPVPAPSPRCRTPPVPAPGRYRQRRSPPGSNPQTSSTQGKCHSLLDAPRLASLWSYAHLVGPRPFHSFDPFEHDGFSALTPDDKLFRSDDFLDTAHAPALAEFTAALPEFPFLSLFPSQGLPINRNLW